jgi:hypothetical protein
MAVFFKVHSSVSLPGMHPQTRIIAVISPAGYVGVGLRPAGQPFPETRRPVTKSKGNLAKQKVSLELY